MDAAQALADLTEISSEVVHVVIVDGDGSLLASTVGDEQRAERLVAATSRLLEEAERLARARGLGELSQLEASTLEGSVFAARSKGRADRGDDASGSDRRTRLLRPEALSRVDRGDAGGEARSRQVTGSGDTASQEGRQLCVSR